MPIRNFAVGTLTLLALAVSPGSAHASLGQPYSSVSADGAKMKAAIRVTSHEAYQVHEMTTAVGVTVRQYAGSDGIVFAVAWAGPFPPDLRQVLGQYFTDYSEEARASSGMGNSAAGGMRRSGRTHLSLSRSDLVIKAGGHMRFFTGKAYLPAHIPSGVSTDAIR